MDSGSIAFETVIEQAESNRQAAEKARRDAENTLSEIEEEREALDKEVRTFEEKRTELLEKARDKSVKKIAEANEYADIIKAELKAILDEAGDLIEQAKASALSAEEAKSAPSRGDFYRRLDENRKMLKQLDGEFRNIGNAKDSGSGKGNGSGSDNGYRRDNGKGNGSSSGSGSGNSNSRKARSSSGFGSGRKLSYRSSAQAQSRLEKDDVRIGDTVRFVTLDAEGQVTTLPDDKGELQILVGRIRMTVPLSELRAVRGGNPDKNTRDGRSSGGARSGKNKKASSRGLYSARLPGVSGATQIQLSKANTISSSIDLHGQTLDDAIMIADKYIDDAMLAGFGEVSLVHGRGEGILRAGLRQMLRSHKHVKKVRSGGPDEGGDGATIVTLK
jgi:dsDNA-specific endonuclease/ATPase MutS2